MMLCFITPICASFSAICIPPKHPECMLQVTQDVCENSAEITVIKLAQQNYLILGKKNMLVFGYVFSLRIY